MVTFLGHVDLPEGLRTGLHGGIEPMGEMDRTGSLYGNVLWFVDFGENN